MKHRKQPSTSHRNGASVVCCISWRLQLLHLKETHSKYYRVLKVFPQLNEQAYGFMPLCCFICRLREELLENVFPQIEQEDLFRYLFSIRKYFLWPSFPSIVFITEVVLDCSYESHCQTTHYTLLQSAFRVGIVIHRIDQNKPNNIKQQVH